METDGGVLPSTFSLIASLRAPCFTAPSIRHILKNGNQNLFRGVGEQLRGEAVLPAAFWDLMPSCHEVLDEQRQVSPQHSGPPRSFAFAFLPGFPGTITLPQQLSHLGHIMTEMIQFLHSKTISEGQRKKWETREGRQGALTLAMDKRVRQGLDDFLMALPAVSGRAVLAGLSWDPSLLCPELPHAGAFPSRLLH